MTPFDFVNSITYNKQNLFDQYSTENEANQEYVTYIINKALSLYPDTVLTVNQINMHTHLDKKLQYEYLLNIIRPMKRFAKWVKKTDSEDLEMIKKYYNFNNQKAKQALAILQPDDLESIKQQLQRGG